MRSDEARRRRRDEGAKSRGERRIRRDPEDCPLRRDMAVSFITVRFHVLTVILM